MYAPSTKNTHAHTHTHTHDTHTHLHVNLELFCHSPILLQDALHSCVQPLVHLPPKRWHTALRVGQNYTFIGTNTQTHTHRHTHTHTHTHIHTAPQKVAHLNTPLQRTTSNRAAWVVA